MPLANLENEAGQTMTEYSVVVGVLVLGVVAAVGFFGTAVGQYIQSFATLIGGSVS